MRLLAVAMVLVLLGVLATACGDSEDSAEPAETQTVTSSTPDATPSDATADPGGDRVVVDAPIDEVDILVLESFPVQYDARIVSGLPSGCALFDAAEITVRTGNEITIRVTNTVPADENVACTAIYGTKETTVPLGTDFVSGETYTVQVNDNAAQFTAQ
jgi:inhibitor of cysteine peptidase